MLVYTEYRPPSIQHSVSRLDMQEGAHRRISWIGLGGTSSASPLLHTLLCCPPRVPCLRRVFYWILVYLPEWHVYIYIYIYLFILLVNYVVSLLLLLVYNDLHYNAVYRTVLYWTILFCCSQPLKSARALLSPELLPMRPASFHVLHRAILQFSQLWCICWRYFTINYCSSRFCSR